jgi:hypothetical protein
MSFRDDSRNLMQILNLFKIENASSIDKFPHVLLELLKKCGLTCPQLNGYAKKIFVEEMAGTPNVKGGTKSD